LSKWANQRPCLMSPVMNRLGLVTLDQQYRSIPTIRRRYLDLEGSIPMTARRCHWFDVLKDKPQRNHGARNAIIVSRQSGFSQESPPYTRFHKREDQAALIIDEVERHLAIDIHGTHTFGLWVMEQTRNFPKNPTRNGSPCYSTTLIETFLGSRLWTRLSPNPHQCGMGCNGVSCWPHARFLKPKSTLRLHHFLYGTG